MLISSVLQDPGLALTVAAFLASITVLMWVVISRFQHRGSLGLGGEGLPAPPVMSSEAWGRVDRAAQVLSALLMGRHSVTREALRQRLSLAAVGPLQSQYLHAAGEIADGLVMIARAVPDAALHDGNVVLLAKLRAFAGSRDFLFICGQMAAVLGEARHHELAERLALGDLAWVEFLFLIRGLSCGDLLTVNPPSVPKPSPPPSRGSRWPQRRSHIRML